MESENKVPAIRFKGFSEKWKEKELSHEIETIGTGKSVFEAKPEKNEKNKFAILGSRNVIGYDCNYDYSGHFILTARVGENAGKLYKHSGKVKITDNTVFIKSKKLNYIFYLLTNFDLKKLAFGTGQPLIKASEINTLKPLISENPEEQTKIGEYFQQLDILIDQHQKKHDKLLKIKKSLLEKMFPKQGATEPAIRFKVFSGIWKEKTLGEVVEITTGKLDANAMKTNGAYDFYTSGIKKYKIDIPAFDGPAITIAGNGATVGYMHLADGKFNAYQRTYVLKSFNVNRYFLFFQIGILLPIKISQEVRAGNIPYIVLDMLTDLDLKLPTKKEQAKIDTLFKNLDSLLSQHQTQLTKLGNIKQACLAKMFV